MACCCRSCPRSAKFALSRVSLVGAFVILLSFAATAQETLLRQAHFDAADIAIKDANSHYRLLMENGETFNMPYQGVAKKPWLSRSVAMDGDRSLGLSVGASKDGQTENDRSEFTVVHQGDKDALHLGQDRYLGFAIYFNTHDFPPPTREIIVSQCWQAYLKNPTGPPAFLVMSPNRDDLSFQLATRSDDSPRSRLVPLTDAHFVRDHWNSVVIHVLPRAVGDRGGPGLIELWLDGKYLGGAHRFWGYAPTAIRRIISMFASACMRTRNPSRIRCGSMMCAGERRKRPSIPE